MDEKTEYVPSPETGEGAFLDVKSVILALEEAGLDALAEEMHELEMVAKEGFASTAILDDIEQVDRIGGGEGDDARLSDRARELRAALRQELTALFQRSVQNEVAIIDNHLASRSGLYVVHATHQPLYGVQAVYRQSGVVVEWRLPNREVIAGTVGPLDVDTGRLADDERLAVHDYRERYEL